jgi:hypothetical protein
MVLALMSAGGLESAFAAVFAAAPGETWAITNAGANKTSAEVNPKAAAETQRRLFT